MVADGAGVRGRLSGHREHSDDERLGANAETGILHLVSASGDQLCRLILSQALWVGLISLVPGTVIGLVLAYLFNLLSALLLAHAVEFQIDAGIVIGCLAVAMLITLIAAMPGPAGCSLAGR